MTMTSKERVRNAIMHKPVDKIPAGFIAIEEVKQNLMKRYGFDDIEQLYDKFGIDVRYTGARCKLKFPVEVNEKGNTVKTSFWGFKNEFHTVDGRSYPMTCFYPLNDVTTIEEVDNYNWPQADWFDYSVVTDFCKKHKDKAILLGHEGPFQIVTNLISMENFFILMIDYPEVAQRILDKMVEFELAYYEQMFIAGEGLVDILRTHDDYGTQISMLFSVDMWKEFFAENTKKLTDLAHKYGAFFEQHSCGAVAPLIPEFIKAGIDVLDPIQPVDGLLPEQLKEKYSGKLCFSGGINAQHLLKEGSPEEVSAETKRYLDNLNDNGGYILMASNGFEAEIPLENIEAIYSVDRTIK